MSDRVNVYFETRISTLIPKGKPNSHNAFREVGKDDTILDPWRCCIKKKDTGEIKMWNSGDYDSLLDEDKNEFSDYWANIYRDNCIYWGNEEVGYFRIRERIVEVNGIMFDFDCHSPTDMTREEIGKIVRSAKFMELPFSRLVFTGNGFQVHFKTRLIVNDDNREEKLATLDFALQCLVQYFIIEFGLKPDLSCTDPNRLYRRENSYNTKKCKDLLDKNSRIKVEVIKEKDIEDSVVDAFLLKVQNDFAKYIPETVKTEPSSIPSNSSLDLKNLISALDTIDPDSPNPSGKNNSEYDTWAMYGAAIKLSFPGEDGFKVWDNWSKKGAKYNAAEMSSKWDSFKRTTDSSNVVTIASIFKEAQDKGWEEPVHTEMMKLSGVGNSGGSAFEVDTTPTYKSKPPINHKELMTKTFVPVKWLVNSIISDNSITMIFGKEKIGKSFWVLSMAYCISAGADVFGSIKSVKTDVLYFALEDTEQRLQARIMNFNEEKPELGSLPRNLYFATKESGVEGMDGSFFAYIDDFIKDHPIHLIIIDTIVRVQGSPSMKKDAYQNSSAIVIKLQAYAMLRKLAIIFVHHECKNNKGEVFDAASGGKGYGAQADTQIRIERPHMTKMGTLSIRGRDMEDRVYNMEFVNCDWRLINDPMSVASDREKEVYAAIEAGNVKLKDIETFIDCDAERKIGYQNLKALVSKMFKKGLIGKSDKGKYYPKQAPTTDQYGSDDIFNTNNKEEK